MESTTNGATAAANTPSLLRRYEESLTRAISPRSARGLSNANASLASPSGPRSSATAAQDPSLAVRPMSPRAVLNSPRNFDEVGSQSFPFLQRRNRNQLKSENKDQDEYEEKLPASDQDAQVQLEDVDTTNTGADKGDDYGEGCLICMDEFTERRKAYPLPCTSNCVGAYVHYRCIMAWLGQSGSCPLCRGLCDPLVLEPLERLELDDIHKVALQPVPLDAGIIRCYVKQVYRGLFKQYSYELYMQGQLGTQEEDRFLLTAKRQVRANMTANYTIYTDREGSEESRIGRMGSNFLGTCFTMYDNGRDPQKLAKVQDAICSEDVAQNVLQIREELGCVTYEPNRTSVGPRKMRVVVPDVDESGGASKVVRPMSRQDRLASRLANNEMKDLMRFANREPVFREDLGAYCLDFGGRVSMASVKNFQLIHTEDPSMGNVLQFGRVADDTFTMDFQWPLSPFQAFAICLSSCDTKLACV